MPIDKPHFTYGGFNSDLTYQDVYLSDRPTSEIAVSQTEAKALKDAGVSPDDVGSRADLAGVMRDTGPNENTAQTGGDGGDDTQPDMTVSRPLQGGGGGGIGVGALLVGIAVIALVLS